MMDVDQLVRCHGPMVWRTVYRIVGGRKPDVDDCFQEVFVAALEVAAREKVGRWEAMLRRLAMSKALDCLRRRIRQRDRTAIGDRDPSWDQIAAGDAGPEQLAESRERVEQLRMALAQLEPQLAELFSLRYVEALSYAEIAAAMNLTPSAVGVLLHRAKGQLAELMGVKAQKMGGET